MKYFLSRIFAKPCRTAPRRRSSRLWVAQLEDRVTPATFTVTTLADSGAGTLRDAVNQANANGGLDTITFQAGLTGPVDLMTALPTITGDLTLTGPGANAVTVRRSIQATADFGIFAIDIPATGTVSISGLTIAGGKSDTDGGAISLFDDNLTVADSVITGNSAAGGGGGIAATDPYQYGTANVTVRNSVISGNTAGKGGGGVYFAYGGSLLVQSSTISGNTSTNQSGGGVYFFGTVGAGGFKISNSTIHGNTAKVAGGGVYLAYLDGTADVRNTTITGNAVQGSGGGIRNLFVPPLIPGNQPRVGTLRLVSSVVAENTAPTFRDVRSDKGVTADNTFFGSAQGQTITGANNFTTGTDAAPLDPMLRPLTNNGGLTPTRRPMPTSPLVGAGANPDGLATDQRGAGFVRASGPVDIGAVEVQPADPPFVSAVAAPSISTRGGTTYQFDVTFDDDTALDVSSLIGNSAAVQVVPPTGPALAATFVGISAATNGAPRTVTYSITPPGGQWDPTDNGTYQIRVLANQVKATDGVTIPAGAVGSFTVAIPPSMVTNTKDSGLGSLRQALLDANSSPGPDLILFDPAVFSTPQTIALSTGELRINDSVTVRGPGAGLLTVRSSAPNQRVFNIDGPGTLNVTLSGLTISGGNLSRSSTPGQGAGVFIQDENVTLDHVTVTGNTAVANGAGVVLEGAGSLTVVDSVLSNNRSTGTFFGDGNGGAIAVMGGGTVVLRRTTVSGNTANGSGGGVYFAFNGSLQVFDSTLSGNTANGTVALAGGGGAINFGGSPSTGGFLIVNSTIVGNRATTTAGGGIALSNFSFGTAVIRNSTITGNVGGPPSGGGGIAFISGTGTVALESTVVAQNSAPAGAPDIFIAAGSGTLSASKSLIGDATGLTIGGSGNLTGTQAAPLDPLLGPLQDNGGATLTRAPLPGSPVTDAGSNPAGLAADQRGLGRVFGGAADIGAVEGQPATLLGITTTAPATTNAATVTYTLTFDQPVTGLSTANLAVGGVSGAAITAVNQVGTGRTWTVTVDTGTGDGTLRIQLVSGTGLSPALAPSGLPIPGPAITIDKSGPRVQSIITTDPNPTLAASVNFRVRFDSPVLGLTAASFTLRRTGTAQGILGTPVTTDGGTTWTVPVTAVSGNGDVELDLAAGSGVTDAAGNPVANAPFAGAAYHVGQPIIAGITTNATPITGLAQVVYTVTFNQPVSGFTQADVALVTSPTLTGAQITDFTGAGTQYQVTVSTGTGTGNLRLDVTGGGGMTTPLTTGVGNSPFRGPTLQVDKVAPSVVSFTRIDPAQTAVSTVRFALSFSEPVTGLSAANFDVAVTGLSGAAVSSIVGTGRDYTVVVTAGAGSGTITLSLANSTNLTDVASNPVTPVPVAGPTYTVDRTQPSAQTITRLDPSPTTAATVRFEVAFSEPVTGVGVGNFALAATSLTGASIAGVAVSAGSNGDRYTVTVNAGTGTGTISLSLVDRTGITDAAGNQLSGALAGPTYQVDRTFPAVSGIDLLDPGFTRAGTVRFGVHFNKPVVGLTAANFTLDAPGLNGAQLLGVSGSGADYVVTATTGNGSGTLSLVLANSTGLADVTGKPVTGLPVVGPAYSIDRLPPSVAVALDPTQPAVSPGGVIRFQVAFGEPVSGFDASDVVLGGTARGQVVGVSGGPSVYQVNIAYLSGVGTLSLSVPAGAAADAAGNISTASGSAAVTLDLPPTAVSDSFTAGAGGILAVPAPGLVGNDTDPEGKPLTAVLVAAPPAAAGKLTLSADGSFTFAAANGFSGPTSFTYAASDGRSLSAPVQVNLVVEPRTTLTAVAAGPGGAPVVVVHNADGSVRFAFMALEQQFTGGVRVAAGDVTGDGVDDIVVVAGPGGGPHLRVIDGRTQREVFNFFAYDPSFTGGMYLAVGDIDGDGHADIITGAGAGGGPHVRVFSGADLTVLKNFFAYAPDFRGGVTVAVGDADGDGVTDIVTGPASGGAPHVRVFRSTDLEAVRSFFAFDPPFNGGITVAVGTAAGGPAIFVGSAVGNNLKVFGGPNGTKVLATQEFASGSPAQGVRLATKDTNGDGLVDELLIAPGPGEIARVRRLKLPSFAPELPLTTFPPEFLGGLYVG